MNLKQMVCEGVDRIILLQDKLSWRPPVATFMKGNFLTC
jgi:hypothetical protein